jgi:hypothetical protein
MGFGNDSVEHGVPLVLHGLPVHIDVWSDCLLSFLDHFDVPVYLEVVPESVIMQVGCPNIRVIIPLNHGMVLLLCVIHGPMRLTVIHSPKGVQVVWLERWNHFLNGVA